MMHGVSSGFYYSQPAPRQNIAPMAGKSTQSSHLSPHSRHLSTLIRISGKSMSGMGWEKASKQQLQNQSGLLTNLKIQFLQSFNVPRTCKPALVRLTTN